MSMHRKILILTAVGLGYSSGQIRQSVPPRLAEGPPPRVHRTWSVFAHPRMGYELPIPPGVRAAGDPVAGKEARFQSADGDFAMAASGGTISDYPASVIATQWNSALRKADRRVTYQRRGNTWFVVSGTDAQGIEFYEKFTMRGQQVAFLVITFPKARIRQFESWVEQIEDGFRPVSLRDGTPEFARSSSRSPTETVERKPAPRKASTGTEVAMNAPERESKPTERPSNRKPESEVAAPTAQLPSASKVAGKPGFVYSPFSSDERMVDVTDIPAGTKVKCPYTMKIFRVP